MISKFDNDEDGQTTVEYLLIIAVVVVVISVLGKGMKDKLPGVVDEVFVGVTAKIKQLMGAARQ